MLTRLMSLIWATRCTFVSTPPCRCSRDYWYIDDVEIVGAAGGGSLAINDVSIAEGDSGSSNLKVFTVTRSGDTSGTSSVNFAAVDGTANSPSDYVATSGTVQFLGG